MPQLNCLSCHQPYEELDVEAYYCPNCLTARKRFAADIDKKFANRVPRVRVPSELELYDQALKANGGRFPNAKHFS